VLYEGVAYRVEVLVKEKGPKRSKEAQGREGGTPKNKISKSNPTQVARISQSSRMEKKARDLIAKK